MRWPWSRDAREERKAVREAPPPREVRLSGARVILDPRPTVTSAVQHCEYCGARAKVRADFDSGSLWFCGHHAYSMWSPLVDKAQLILVDDSREMHWLPSNLFADVA